MGNYENGKMEGPWEGYSENGLLHFKGKYKNGKYHGFWEWFNADGSRNELTGTYKHGLKISE